MEDGEELDSSYVATGAMDDVASTSPDRLLSTASETTLAAVEGVDGVANSSAVTCPFVAVPLFVATVVALLPFVAVPGDDEPSVVAGRLLLLLVPLIDVAVEPVFESAPAFASITVEEVLEAADTEEEAEELLGAFVLPPDSISIVVSGPVPREHWYSTREMMSATCWSSM